VKLLSRIVTLRVAAKTAADVGGKAVMLLITVVAARRLNPDPFAILALAMATGWLLGVATDAGLSMHLARETARHPRRGRQLLVEIISLRAGLAFLAATIAVLATPYLVPRHWRMQFLVIVLAQLCGAVIETVAHYFRGLQRTEIEAAIHAAHRVATLLLALAVLWWWRRLDFLGVAMLVPALIAMLVSIGIAFQLSIRLKPDTADEYHAEPNSPALAGLTPRSFLINVFPLGAAALLSALYFRIDVYFIQQWHGFQPVGGYNAAFRLVEALRLFPAAVMAVTFPLLVHSRDTALLRKIGGGLGVAGLLLAAVCGVGAPVIIPLIYGEFYAYATSAFAVLALALPFFFVNYALTHQVIAWDGQRAYLAIVVVALAGNIAANLLLVPSRGIVGAAIATVLTEIIVTWGCLYVLARHDLLIGRFADPQGVPNARAVRVGAEHEGSAS
jgi:O-antigen/teichoic acid export membrane protein